MCHGALLPRAHFAGYHQSHARHIGAALPDILVSRYCCECQSGVPCSVQYPVCGIHMPIRPSFISSMGCGGEAAETTEWKNGSDSNPTATTLTPEPDPRLAVDVPLVMPCLDGPVHRGWLIWLQGSPVLHGSWVDGTWAVEAGIDGTLKEDSDASRTGLARFLVVRQTSG